MFVDMYGPVLLFLSVSISTSTARTGPSGTPDSKTGCYAYFHDLIGLLRCRIYIMLYRYFYRAVTAQDSRLVNSCLIPADTHVGH